MKAVLFVCTIFTIAYSTTGQVVCNTPDGGFGICKYVKRCPELLMLAKKVERELVPFNKLKDYMCTGPSQVCCPDCYTPDGKAGLCKPFNECYHIRDMAKNPSESNLYYIRHSICYGKSDNINVCCGPPPPARDGKPESCVGKLSAFPPRPDSNCCGVEATSPTKIMGGDVTEIDEYPWLVRLEYKADNVLKLLCGGSLISGKYVLTAAHCVKYLPKGTKLINVRIGEYDIENDGKDCVQTGGGYDCTPPALSVPIEEVIVHPEYNHDYRFKWNDVALLRLEETVEFTDFVRPICLPSTDIDEISFPTMRKPIVASWGKTKNSSRSRYKHSVAVPFVQLQVCQNNYYLKYKSKSRLLWSHQICAGGELGKDSCNGDSGNPLMYIRTKEDGQNITEAIGLVSFGATDCGTENVPGVYTKIIDYIPWIRANIKP